MEARRLDSFKRTFGLVSFFEYPYHHERETAFIKLHRPEELIYATNPKIFENIGHRPRTTISFRKRLIILLSMEMLKSIPIKMESKTTISGGFQLGFRNYLRNRELFPCYLASSKDEGELREFETVMQILDCVSGLQNC